MFSRHGPVFSIIIVTVVTLLGFLITSAILWKTIQIQRTVANDSCGIGARFLTCFWVVRMGLESTSATGLVITMWFFYGKEMPNVADSAGCWALLSGMCYVLLDEAFKLIQLVLEHRLWWVALFGLPPCLLLASQALSSTTASKFLLLVAVVIHRVLCSTLFLSLPLITGSALSNARRLVAPQQLLMLFLFPMLCFAEKIHAMIYLYAICIISKTVMEWRNISVDVLGTSGVHRLEEPNEMGPVSSAPVERFASTLGAVDIVQNVLSYIDGLNCCSQASRIDTHWEAPQDQPGGLLSCLVADRGRATRRRESRRTTSSLSADKTADI